MRIQSFGARLIALAMVVVIGLMGCSSSATGLTGNYRQDTLTVVESLKKAIELPSEDPAQREAKNLASQQMNDYVSRYRRNDKTAGLRSFTTMQTASNSLAGFYGSYGNRPVPETLKKRLQQEFKQAELSLKRGL